jgi:hypothetical protein
MIDPSAPLPRAIRCGGPVQSRFPGRLLLQGPWDVPVVLHPSRDRAGHHLVEHVFPELPIGQWPVPFPKRLRYFLHRDGFGFSLHAVARCGTDRVRALRWPTKGFSATLLGR